MKLNLFLSVVSVFTVFYLCKAGPLRHLQKRAAFYIANETACVVDNIVYTSGDPIPTDDPCEACRCRPPGFACVLKECKIKPGCRAVRHVGECCPEYICGCEHNGRFYKDGEEIKDPKNPCYQCYCQGSSIACAFVDCIYRDECDSVFVPGECCPKYFNCTRDIPDRNLFLGGGNVFQPVNLLPVFNDESILPVISSTDQAVEQPENPRNPIQLENPTNPIQPQNPINPIQLENPTNPIQLENPANPIQFENPANPIQFENSANPIQLENPAIPIQFENPTNPMQPENPTDPIQFENPINPVQPENPTNPIQPEELDNAFEKAVTSETSESEDTSSKSETVEPESLVTEEKSFNTEVEEKDAEPLESTTETYQDSPKENDDKEAIESSEETKTVLNSESDINKDEAEENTRSESPELTTEPEKELPQTTVESKSEETVNEGVTEKPSETESPSTALTEKDPQIKNSASENSKSLKLTDTEQLEQEKEDQQNVKSDMKTEEAITEKEQASESTSVMPTVDLKENPTTENRLPSEEIFVEKNQENSQAIPININNAKIKSESAETVTIVVHIKESSKIPTETDFIAETVTPIPITSVSEENILKSNDEVDTKKESFETEVSKSTNKDFEIFPTTKQTSEVEFISKSPSTEQNTEDVQGKSDEADNIAMEAEENSVSEPDPKASDSNNGDNLSTITSTMSVIEDKTEARTDEVTEEAKADESMITIIEIDTNRPPISVKTKSNSNSSLKPQQSITELKNVETKELQEEKEIKNEKPEEIVEVAPEVRSDTVEQEEKSKETTTVQSKEESITEQKSTENEKTESTTEKGMSIPEEKVQESTQTNIDDRPEIRTNDEAVTEKTEDKISTESVEEKQTKVSKPETTTESKIQVTEESEQTTLSNN